MNSNDLNKAVMKIVQQEIEPIVTKYMQQHPEYFHDCVHSNGKICNLNITLSYQPESLTDIKNTTPTVFVFLGDLNKGLELNCYSHNKESLQSRFWINKKIVTDRTVGGSNV